MFSRGSPHVFHPVVLRIGEGLSRRPVQNSHKQEQEARYPKELISLGTWTRVDQV
jgi:hypothetical protein